MMEPEALQGWAPWFGQWCSFAMAGRTEESRPSY